MSSREENIPRLTLPLSRETALNMAVGDRVMLDGEMIATAGYPTHQRIVEALAGKRQLPFPLHGSAIFHLGSSCREVDGRWFPNYVNPTTSTRFDAYMPDIIRKLELTSVAGKGGMGAECVAAMRDAGCVYFAIPGGASPLLSGGVEERLETGWDDLIEQFRLSRFRLRGFGPAIVAIDAHGRSLYQTLQDRAARRLPDILSQLQRARSGTQRND